MRPARAERGTATVWGVALIGLLALVTVVCVAVVAVVAGHRRAQAAADLAALAGAGTLRDGGEACAAAGRIARRNRGEVVTCEVSGQRVRVVVQVRVRGLLGREHLLRGRALAGPDRLSP